LEYAELRIQYCFAGFFVVELLMRIIADGKHFFCGEDFYNPENDMVVVSNIFYFHPYLGKIPF